MKVCEIIINEHTQTNNRKVAKCYHHFSHGDTDTNMSFQRFSFVHNMYNFIVNIIIQKSYTNLTCISYPQLTEDSAYVNGESIVEYTCSFIVF